MADVSAELLLTVAMFVLLSVAAGTFAARLFMAAIRPRSSGNADHE